MILDHQSLYYNSHNSWIWINHGDYVPPVFTNGDFFNPDDYKSDNFGGMFHRTIPSWLNKRRDRE